MTELTISIAAYNDGPSLAAVVTESIAVARELVGPRFAILVINDGSCDSTAEVAAGLAREHAEVTVHTHPQNMGFGPTLSQAYLLPCSEWVVFLPGDGQVPPAELRPMFAKAADHDLVLAWRSDRHDPPNRRFVSWCYNQMVSILAGCRVHDVNGTALVRQRLLGASGLWGTSAFVHAEVLLRARAAGARHCEVAIAHRAREHGQASGNRLGVVLATFRDLLRYAIGRR